ncbi:helix-turn-helix domain-containing protein [Clostridioides sp. ZZV15-6598]|uniref:helix-turn-helix transcriptional regulator n=1 Tax=Clostridioides sp. ZZV15-6598 TaxID=2811501 RepID=UPI001D103218|nr:helix-turn-helix transcriptional regulator [Clostridioides sp. ZZV15-6598]
MKNYILKSLRVRQGLRQRDLAKILGMNPNTYSSKENGDRRFTVSEAMKISDFFNTDVKDIFLNK